MSMGPKKLQVHPYPIHGFGIYFFFRFCRPEETYVTRLKNVFLVYTINCFHVQDAAIFFIVIIKTEFSQGSDLGVGFSWKRG